MRETPIVINNFNRLTSTRNMYEFLTGRGFKNITILDNGSTYKPLIEWYSTLNAGTVKLFPNLGAYCLFESGYLKTIESEYIIYSDSDLELNPKMPDDFIGTMKLLMTKYGEKKIGLALRIDDIPENCYKNVMTGSIEHEKQFWKHQLEENVYLGMVDTTFCLLHKPEIHEYEALRVAGDFTARHLPWYQDYSSLNNEEIYFIQHANPQSNFRNGYYNWLGQHETTDL